MHRNSNFSESSFHCAGFKKCNMIYSNFTNCKFDGFKTIESDFSDCDIEEIVVSESKNELKGIIVNSFQALDLSRMFGIVIK